MNESHTNLPWKASVVICRSWWFWRIWHLLQALQMPFEFICSSFICLFTAWKNRLHRRSWLEDMIPEEFQILYSINLHLAMKKIQEFHRCYFEIISEKKLAWSWSQSFFRHAFSWTAMKRQWLLENAKHSSLTGALFELFITAECFSTT